MSPRRNATATARTERRDQLLVLLSRAERGMLTRSEAAQLRVNVGAELVEGDAARRAAAGQQSAVRREQRRLVAAEDAIREIEADRDRLARAGFDERRRHRAEVVEAHRLVEQAEARTTRAEQQLDDEEARSTRYANYLLAAQRACGAPNWPALPATIRALAERPSPVEQQCAATHH